MHQAGFFETILFFTIVIVLLGMMALSIRKFYKSEIPFNKKMIWIFFFIITNALGLVIFLFYHDYFLSPYLRAKSDS